MNTQEAQTLVNNWKGSKDDPKYLEAKDFLENQQKEGEKAEKKKSLKEKLVMSPEEMQKMTGERTDVQNAARRSEIANPSVGIVDRVMGNVTGRNEDLLDPLAFKAKDLNADGSIKEKDLQLGNGTSGNFIGAEGSEGGNGGSGPISSSGIDKNTKSYLDKNDEIAETVEEKQLKRLLEHSNANWKQMTDTSAKVRNAYNDIDDKYIEQLPTFMFRRYQNGEFGDISDTSTPEGRESKKNAQLRLAHFMINGLGTALSNASHVIRKDGQTEQSDYEKIQGSNLEQGIANRWKKNNAETEEVIKIANKEADNEQDARIYVEQLTRDNMLKSGWNAMDQNQKLYAINVSREIGKMIGDMNVEELSNFITAQALNGNLSEQQAVVVGLASLVSKTPELLQKMPEGGVKSAVMSLLGIGK
jgi:hypothetical protein